MQSQNSQKISQTEVVFLDNPLTKTAPKSQLRRITPYADQGYHALDFNVDGKMYSQMWSTTLTPQSRVNRYFGRSSKNFDYDVRSFAERISREHKPIPDQKHFPMDAQVMLKVLAKESKVLTMMKTLLVDGKHINIADLFSGEGNLSLTIPALLEAQSSHTIAITNYGQHAWRHRDMFQSYYGKNHCLDTVVQRINYQADFFLSNKSLLVINPPWQSSNNNLVLQWYYAAIVSGVNSLMVFPVYLEKKIIRALKLTFGESGCEVIPSQTTVQTGTGVHADWSPTSVLMYYVHVNKVPAFNSVKKLAIAMNPATRQPNSPKNQQVQSPGTQGQQKVSDSSSKLTKYMDKPHAWNKVTQYSKYRASVQQFDSQIHNKKIPVLFKFGASYSQAQIISDLMEYYNVSFVQRIIGQVFIHLFAHICERLSDSQFTMDDFDVEWIKLMAHLDTDFDSIINDFGRSKKEKVTTVRNTGEAAFTAQVVVDKKHLTWDVEPGTPAQSHARPNAPSRNLRTKRTESRESQRLDSMKFQTLNFSLSKEQLADPFDLDQPVFSDKSSHNNSYDKSSSDSPKFDPKTGLFVQKSNFKRRRPDYIQIEQQVTYPRSDDGSDDWKGGFHLLQEENVTLQCQVHDLTADNERLTDDIQSLQTEVRQLQAARQCLLQKVYDTQEMAKAEIEKFKQQCLTECEIASTNHQSEITLSREKRQLLQQQLDMTSREANITTTNLKNEIACLNQKLLDLDSQVLRKDYIIKELDNSLQAERLRVQEVAVQESSYAENLQQQLKQRQDEIQALQKETQNLQSNIRTISDNATRMKKSFKEKKSSFQDQLKSLQREKEEDVRSLNQKLLEKTELCTTATLKLEMLLEQQSNTQKIISDFEEQKKLFSSQLKRMADDKELTDQKQVLDLQLLLQEEQTKNQELSTQIQQLQLQQVSLQQNLSQKSQEIATLKETVSRLEVDMDAVERKLQGQFRLVSQLESDKQILVKEKYNLQSQLDVLENSLKTTKSQLGQKVQESEHQLKRKNQELQDLRKQQLEQSNGAQEKDAKIQALQLELNQSVSTVTQLRKLQNDSNLEVQQLNQELTKVRNDLSVTSIRLDDVRSKQLVSQSDQTHLLDELNDTKQQLQLAREKVAKAELEFSQLNSSAVSTKTQLVKAQTQLQSQLSEVSRLQQENSVLQEQNSILSKSQLDRSDSSQLSLLQEQYRQEEVMVKSRLAQKETESKMYQAQVLDLKKQLQEQKMALSQFLPTTSPYSSPLKESQEGNATFNLDFTAIQSPSQDLLNTSFLSDLVSKQDVTINNDTVMQEEDNQQVQASTLNDESLFHQEVSVMLEQPVSESMQQEEVKDPQLALELKKKRAGADLVRFVSADHVFLSVLTKWPQNAKDAYLTSEQVGLISNQLRQKHTWVLDLVLHLTVDEAIDVICQVYQLAKNSLISEQRRANIGQGLVFIRKFIQQNNIIFKNQKYELFQRFLLLLKTTNLDMGVSMFSKNADYKQLFLRFTGFLTGHSQTASGTVSLFQRHASSSGLFEKLYLRVTNLDLKLAIVVATYPQVMRAHFCSLLFESDTLQHLRFLASDDKVPIASRFYNVLAFACADYICQKTVECQEEHKVQKTERWLVQNQPYDEVTLTGTFEQKNWKMLLTNMSGLQGYQRTDRSFYNLATVQFNRDCLQTPPAVFWYREVDPLKDQDLNVAVQEIIELGKQKWYYGLQRRSLMGAVNNVAFADMVQPISWEDSGHQRLWDQLGGGKSKRRNQVDNLAIDRTVDTLNTSLEESRVRYRNRHQAGSAGRTVV